MRGFSYSLENVRQTRLRSSGRTARLDGFYSNALVLLILVPTSMAAVIIMPVLVAADTLPARTHNLCITTSQHLVDGIITIFIVAFEVLFTHLTCLNNRVSNRNG